MEIDAVVVKLRLGFIVCLQKRSCETFPPPPISFSSLLFSSLLPPLLPPFLPTHTAKVELEDINRWPNTPSARRANTDKAADFLRKDGVMLHHDAVKGKTATVK